VRRPGPVPTSRSSAPTRTAPVDRHQLDPGRHGAAEIEREIARRRQARRARRGAAALAPPASTDALVRPTPSCAACSPGRARPRPAAGPLRPQPAGPCPLLGPTPTSGRHHRGSDGARPQ
jgi:hypothetical protein